MKNPYCCPYIWGGATWDLSFAHSGSLAEALAYVRGSGALFWKIEAYIKPGDIRFRCIIAQSPYRGFTKPKPITHAAAYYGRIRNDTKHA